ncbi:hypothetical protein MYP_689 [Sporocytophaga myxococcoides]|uniref:Uncharacterized protein n=1 Tax=Sporocytophaga myxococcoides TaxID=153721 RepID=A0A098LAK0_9BACT|nr:hypothetical protein [Sporocytophaga myxococcoides]GAL83462.1 hypothetical protein MYP_689 [Sporocytophaga myxococcoides]
MEGALINTELARQVLPEGVDKLEVATNKGKIIRKENQSRQEILDLISSNPCFLTGDIACSLGFGIAIMLITRELLYVQTDMIKVKELSDKIQNSIATSAKPGLILPPHLQKK